MRRLVIEDYDKLLDDTAGCYWADDIIAHLETHGTISGSKDPERLEGERAKAEAEAKAKAARHEKFAELFDKATKEAAQKALLYAKEDEKAISELCLDFDEYAKQAVS